MTSRNITQRLVNGIFRLKGNLAQGSIPAIRSSGLVEITPFRTGAGAAATISADFEIAWAFRGSNEEERLQRAAASRRNVPYILHILEEMGVPITWATVGHLFLERCERGRSGAAHEDMPRPPKNLRWDGDWYRHDPCTDWKTDHNWYAPDLIELIRSSEVNHEIGSHSFSHIDFSEDTSTPELVEHEIEACIRIMAHHGFHLRSLVYPFNNMGHQYLDLLSSLGLTAVRHRDERIRLSYPERTPSGIYKLYESMNLRRPRHYDYVEKAKMFIEEACARQAAYHIWFHPSDPTTIFEREFHGIIQHMAKLRGEGKLWVATMSELAAYCEAREQTSLHVEREANELKVALRSNFDAERYGKTILTLRILCDSIPAECLFRTKEDWEPVKWRRDELVGGPERAQSFLVDVPAMAGELRVIFRTNNDCKGRHSTTVADSALC